MLTIKNTRTLEGKTTELSLPSAQNLFIDAQGLLTQLPALIDPYAHFRPETSEAILTAGITTLLVPPDASSSTFKEFQNKTDQIAKAQSPLRVFLYMGSEQSDPTEVGEEIGKVKKEAVGIWIEAAKIAQDAEKKSILDRLIQVAAQDELVVSTRLGEESTKARLQSMQTLLTLAQKYNTEMAFMDIRSQEELNLLRDAKQEELLVFGATSLSHLYQANAEVLWNAIQDGTIEMIGSGEMPLKWALPLLLNSYHERKITLEKIVSLTRRNIENIFHLKQQNDLVLVNLEKTQTISEGILAGKTLCGCPVYTIVNGEIFRGRP